MRILFISNNRCNETSRRNQLKPLSEKWSLHFSYSITEANNFLQQDIIKKQKPLDLIIGEYMVGIESTTKYFEEIRFNIDDTYSNRDFNLREIPTSVIFSNRRMAMKYYSDAWSQNTISTPNDEVLNIKQYADQIKNWRRQVLEEMHILGINLNSGNIDYSTYFSSNRRFKTDTKILSNNFKTFPRTLKFDWLIHDTEQIKIIIDEYIKILKKSMRSKKGQEKKYHQFFNENLSLIKRDSFSRHLYEPKLYYNDRNFFEPDYVLKPEMTFETDLSILEVKLPNELIAKEKKFHPSLRAKFMDHLFQINDYKDYLEEKEYRKQINDVFGFIPQKVEYNILIGRKEHKEENEHIINKRMNQMGSKINIITYDDLLEYQVKYLERLELLTIKH